jgi:DNA polymerase-3 subunit delta'
LLTRWLKWAAKTKRIFYATVPVLSANAACWAGAERIVKLPEQEMETAKKMSAVITNAMAQAIITELEKAHYHIERNANPKILFLDVSLQIIKILNLKTVPAGNHYIPN